MEHTYVGWFVFQHLTTLKKPSEPHGVLQPISLCEPILIERPQFSRQKDAPQLQVIPTLTCKHWNQIFSMVFLFELKTEGFGGLRYDRGMPAWAWTSSRWLHLFCLFPLGTEPWSFTRLHLKLSGHLQGKLSSVPTAPCCLLSQSMFVTNFSMCIQYSLNNTWLVCG